MYKKVRLKKKNKHKTRNIIVLIFIALTITISICFNFIDKKAMPIFMEYATSKTTRLATLIITSAVDNEVFKNMDTNDLFIIEKDSNNNIKYIDFDSLKINKLLNLITNSVDSYIRNVENGNLDKIKGNIESEYKIEDLRKSTLPIIRNEEKEIEAVKYIYSNILKLFKVYDILDLGNDLYVD